MNSSACSTLKLKKTHKSQIYKLDVPMSKLLNNFINILGNKYTKF